MRETREKEEKKRKKTEHTIISHTSRCGERRNIHVMLSYAKKNNKNILKNQISVRK